MRARLTVMLALLAAGASACGGDDDGGSDASTSCPSGAVVIAMVDLEFDPEQANANVGQQVCWRNDDEIDHNAVAESGATFESPLFGKGETFAATLDEPGTVGYVCTIHPGMTGTIEVNPLRR